MHALVLGHDGPAFDTEPADGRDIPEEHQAYMDRWLPRLLARGPLLSADGEEHQGSVHVVEVADLAAARAFATEEPFAAAGWYDEVTVTTYLPLVAGTMWDRPRPPRGTRSSFVLARWEPRPHAGQPVRDPGWVFAGVLLDEQGRSTGLAGALDLPDAEAKAVVAREVPHADLTSHRWRRGGRDQDT